MLHYAVTAGKAKYDRMCYMIRSKAFKAYKEGRWNIHDLLEFNVEKIRQNNYCWYCGKELEPSKLTKDHVFPRSNRIFIKNMVCPRCIMAVETVMEKCGIRYMGVTLGEVTVEEPLTEQQLGMLEEQLQRLGFELLSDQRRQTVERICGGVQEWVGMTGDRPKLSTHLQARLSHEYSSLSKLFSEIKGMSIEQYMKLVRIERVKKELCYGERSIAEISYMLGFSSPAHLSSQFKSVTGMSPRAFQRLGNGEVAKRRRPLDSL